MDVKKQSVRDQRLTELRESLIEQNNADICYIAMMSGIELPEKEEANDDLARQNQELL